MMVWGADHMCDRTADLRLELKVLDFVHSHQKRG